VLPLIERLVAVRPTYGYRRITAILNRGLRSHGLAAVNHKRVYRIMKANNLLLARKYTERPAHTHDGRIIVMRSNLRWRADGFEFSCWNGDVIRAAFISDACDREVISWRAVVNAGISGSGVRDTMLEAVEKRLGAGRAPKVIEMLSDNGAPYIAKETRIFAHHLGLKPCFTPVRPPQSNGISESVVQTKKRDYVHVSPLPDAQTVLALIDGWIEDCNDPPRIPG
jgi:transposase InsO family protein